MAGFGPVKEWGRDGISSGGGLAWLELKKKKIYY